MPRPGRNSGDLIIAGFNTGTLIVADDGVVKSTSTLVGLAAVSNGVVSLDSGGVLETGQVSRGGGASTFTFDGGTLRPTGDQTDLFDGFASGQVLLNSGGGQIDTNGFAVSSGVALSGTGGLTKLGDGTLTLTGASTYDGDTVIEGGALTIAAGGTVSNLAGFIGNTSNSTGAVTVTGDNSSWTNSDWLWVGYFGGGTLTVEDGGMVSSTTGVIGLDAAGSVTVSGAAANGSVSSWTNSDELYVGYLDDGTLTVEEGGTVSSTTGVVGTYATGVATVSGTNANGNASTWANSGDLTIGGFDDGTLAIRGGGLVKSASTTVGLDSGSSGAIALESYGVLETAQVSGGAGTGLFTFDGGTLRLTGDQNALFDGFAPGQVVVNSRGGWIDTNGFAISSGVALSGAGDLTKLGDGTLTLNGVSTAYSGATEVWGGTLIVGDDAHHGASLDSQVLVLPGAVLGGHGTVGDTTVIAGGTLSPGASIGTLTVAGDLRMSYGSGLDFEFGSPGTAAAPGESDSVDVRGDLLIDGTTLNVSNAGGFGPGVYRLFDYDGTLIETNGGIAIGTVPTSVDASELSIQRLTAEKHIDLVSAAGLTMNFWNANGLASATQRGGGDGTWSNNSFVWTDATASMTAPMTPRPGFAIFAGDAGTVTVDGQSGASPVETTGMQFGAGGYHLIGDTLNLVADADHLAPVEIRVGDGGAGSEAGRRRSKTCSPARTG